MQNLSPSSWGSILLCSGFRTLCFVQVWQYAHPASTKRSQRIPSACCQSDGVLASTPSHRQLQNHMHFHTLLLCQLHPGASHSERHRHGHISNKRACSSWPQFSSFGTRHWTQRSYDPPPLPPNNPPHKKLMIFLGAGAALPSTT